MLRSPASSDPLKLLRSSERERERERARENPRSEQIFDQDEILTSVVAEKREKGESKAEAKVPICFSSSFPFLFCFFFWFWFAGGLFFSISFLFFL
jgi:hypothetical protein